MSYFEFNVKDYRILKDAKVEPEGITLIYGKNGSGKSSLIKSLVTLLSNKHSEDNFRHGKDSYSISARCGENTVTYSRSGSNAQVQFNNETPKTKLGKGILYDLEPRFPLKRIDYTDTSFFPNFSFQNSVPVFEDISTTDLFASMFSDVAKISERVTSCRNDVVNTSKIKNDSQVGSDVLKEKVLEASKQVDKIKSENHNLEEQYTYLKGLAVKQSNLARFQAEYAELSVRCSDSIKRALVSLYNEAQPLFADFVFVEKVKNSLIQLERNEIVLGDCDAKLKALKSKFPVDIVTLFIGINQIQTCQSNLEVIRKELEGLPDFNFNLIESVFSMANSNQTLENILSQIKEIPDVPHFLISEVSGLFKLRGDYDTVKSNLIEANHSYDSVVKKLKEFPCERLIDGTCPYQ